VLPPRAPGFVPELVTGLSLPARYAQHVENRHVRHSGAVVLVVIGPSLPLVPDDVG
jgi:hypothetical protein